MKLKNFLSTGLLCCFCGVSMPLLGMNEQKVAPAVPVAPVVKLVLSDRLYKQQARLQVGLASSILEAFTAFSFAMSGLELMRSELKCYLQDGRFSGDVKTFLDKEIIQGLNGVSLDEFTKRSNAVPQTTKLAYKKAVNEKCEKVLSEVLVRATFGDFEG